MRNVVVFVSLALGLSFVHSSCAEDQLLLTLESIFNSSEFQNRTLAERQWAADGASFSYRQRNADTGLNDILSYRLNSGGSDVVVEGATLSYDGKPVHISDYQWSPQRRYLLLAGRKKTTWDNVVEAPWYIYNPANGELRALNEKNAPLRNVRVAPATQQAGYVLDNNLYIVDLPSGKTAAVTRDGSSNIFNGIFDYGSTEFGFRQAWFWSADASKIAFWRLDVSKVKVFYMIDELGKYSKVNALKYPNVGERHAVNRIGVYDVQSGKTQWMDTGEDEDDYIPQITWTNSADTLAIQRLRRDHEKLDLLLADTASGRSRIIVSDSDPAWIDIGDDLLFFAKQKRFVWTSEKSGYRHAYLYDYKGKEKQLTSGDWEISALIAVDEDAGWLYFYAKKDSFIDQHVYRVKLDGSELQKLSDAAGWYEWQMSPDRKRVIETYSDARTPQHIVLRTAAGEELRVLEANKLAAMEKYAMPHTEFIKVRTGDGVSIDGFMIKPLNFDATKKYPVIGYGYGNAGSQVVVNRWGTQRGPRQDLWHRYMAEQGYIIVAFDNRTTAGRGKAAKNLTYGHYGKYAVLDYLEGVNYLKTLPYIDQSRLGFWGWSGGGYLAAALMTKAAPVFKTAVSVAPVIDLSRYQAVGVERWMDFIEDNPQGYHDTNLLNFADKLQGDLLLIHGSGDENVKFAFTLQFANALIANNKQFDMMVYPNRHHGIADAQYHVFTKISHYFFDKL